MVKVVVYSILIGTKVLDYGKIRKWPSFLLGIELLSICIVDYCKECGGCLLRY
jgi:hypothetical protein